MQSQSMNPNWAADNLQTIRTLMERSAVYRRALAPIMIFAGGLGLVAGAVGVLCRLDSATAFGLLWLTTAVVVIAGALLIARKQALKDNEAFWSPPTRRVTQALVPPLLAGLCLGLLALTKFGNELNLIVSLIWVLFYGCALHAAGFFMPRGIRLFGLTFIISGCAGIYALFSSLLPNDYLAEHWLMGFFFGGLHLYLTEPKAPVA